MGGADLISLFGGKSFMPWQMDVGVCLNVQRRPRWFAFGLRKAILCALSARNSINIAASGERDTLFGCCGGR
jgi:hypothetical protein